MCIVVESISLHAFASAAMTAIAPMFSPLALLRFALILMVVVTEGAQPAIHTSLAAVDELSCILMRAWSAQALGVTLRAHAA